MRSFVVALFGAVLAFGALALLVFLVGRRQPYYSGLHWLHGAPPSGGTYRINALLNVPGAQAWAEGTEVEVQKEGPRFFLDGPIEYSTPDWRICGQGVVVSQHVVEGRTVVRFAVVWRYPWWYAAIASWANSAAQIRAQRWALKHHPEMMWRPR